MMPIVQQLKDQFPEFVPSELFDDLLHVVFGEFGLFMVEHMRCGDSSAEVVQRAFDFLGAVFHGADRDVINAVETTVFEQLLDDDELTRQARRLLRGSARAAFDRISEGFVVDGAGIEEDDTDA